MMAHKTQPTSIRKESNNMICRNGQFSILTGWGKGNSQLEKITLKVLSQSECNRRYNISNLDTIRRFKINNNLPQLIQDNLLCAVVCPVLKKYGWKQARLCKYFGQNTSFKK